MKEEILKLEELRNGWLEQVPTNISIANFDSNTFLKKLVSDIRKASNNYAKTMIFASPNEALKFVQKQTLNKDSLKLINYNPYLTFNYISYNLDKNYYIFSEPPVFLGKNELNRLHCTTDYAIYFKDGFGLYYVHGVYFSKKLFEKFFKFKNYSGKDILELNNVEQKAVLIQEHGYKKILEEVGAEVVDTYFGSSKITGKKVIYELLRFKMNRVYLQLVKVEDHTTHKIVTLGVPNNIKTCIEAIAWTFGVDTQDYILYKES